MLDFLNDTETIADSFSDYYRTTILSEETDPNKLHDLQAELDDAQVYAPEQVSEFVEKYLAGADRRRLRPCVGSVCGHLPGRTGRRRAGRLQGQRQGIRANLRFSLVDPSVQEPGLGGTFDLPELPDPKSPLAQSDDDLSKGILETVDMDSYRVEKQAMRSLILDDQDAVIDPVPNGGGGTRSGPEIDHLSVILSEFNDLFGGIAWQDGDRVRRLITEEIPAQVEKDAAYVNARQNSDSENARIEHDKALGRVMTAIMRDDTELFRQFMDNLEFRRWLGGAVFDLTYATPGR